MYSNRSNAAISLFQTQNVGPSIGVPLCNIVNHTWLWMIYIINPEQWGDIISDCGRACCPHLQDTSPHSINSNSAEELCLRSANVATKKLVIERLKKFQTYWGRSCINTYLQLKQNFWQPSTRAELKDEVHLHCHLLFAFTFELTHQQGGRWLHMYSTSKVSGRIMLGVHFCVFPCYIQLNSVKVVSQEKVLLTTL